MFKLCKTCGYINKGDAIECEECHSLLDISIDNTKNQKHEPKKEKKISISDIFSIKSNKKTDDEFTIDTDLIKNTEIAVEDNTIEMNDTVEPNKQEQPAPTENVEKSKKEEKQEIKEKVQTTDTPIPQEEIKSPLPENTQTIIDSNIVIDDNAIDELPPDESIINELFADPDSYDEIPIEESVEVITEIIKDISGESKEIEEQNEETIQIDQKMEDIKVETKTEAVEEKPVIEEKPATEENKVVANEETKENNTSEDEKAQEEKKKEEILSEINENQIDDSEVFNNVIEEEKVEEKKEEPSEKESPEAQEISKDSSNETKESATEESSNKEENTEETEETDTKQHKERPIKDEIDEDIEKESIARIEEKAPKRSKGDITKVKPMEIKKRNNENLNKINNSDEDDIDDAMEIFDNLGTKKTEEAPKEQTIVYELNSAPINKDSIESEESEEHKIIEGYDDSKEKKKKKKHKSKKNKEIASGNSGKPSFIKRSIAISVAIAAIVIAVVIIYFVNRSKELNFLASRLAANEDVSYAQMYNTLTEKGYSEKETNKAIDSLGIDFSLFAQNVLYTAAQDTNKLASKKDIRRILTEKQFSNGEIDNAISNTDWNRYLTIYIDSCVSKVKELDKDTIIKNIQNAEFSALEIVYVKEEYDWSKLAKKNINTFLGGEELHTKEETRAYLIEHGYSDKDIDNTYETYDWDSYAYKYVTKYVEQKAAQGIEINLTRNEYTDILKKADFTDEEIASVMGRYDFASQASTKIDSIITTGSDFVDKAKLKDSLKDEGYTDEEIEKALSETDWNEAAIASLKSLDNTKLSKLEMLKKLTDSGYDPEEVDYANNKYDWNTQGLKYIEYLKAQKKSGSESNLRSILKDSGYLADEIDKLIVSLNFEKSVDWFEEAAKNDLATIKSSDDFTKKKATDYLSSLKYSDKEITYALNSIPSTDWKASASRFLNSTDFDTRVTARQKLQAEGYTNTNESKEIDYALNTIDWVSKCKAYATNIYNQNDDETKCIDINKYNSGGVTSIYQTLVKAEFTEDEIKPALNLIFSNKPPASCKIN